MRSSSADAAAFPSGPVTKVLRWVEETCLPLLVTTKAEEPMELL
eukprot:CAMPEP_0198129496 /NCGR_PEP_ID=MMETSP1442-20131203/51879_1 /TAXON_ID= /ORGANISM="Craspedostauros australis, Strain CCMP3328" /LENGTH=43 /DNA_ID= /DNA_START= /DNA_END= /DNA_ORIENTATION=